jgi:signal transduction histidine kinase
LSHTLEDLNRLATGLHPRVLAEHGLQEALTDIARDVGVPVDLEVTVPTQLPGPTAAAIYFICAEALTNSAKHAAASRVTAVITSGDGLVYVEVADDGIGGADAGLGSGLSGLADRIETLGGMLQIESPPGRGTRLAAQIPLNAEAGETTTLIRS